MKYAAVLDLVRPERFTRPQVILRFFALMALGIIGRPLGSLIALAYLLVPLIAAARIGDRGGARYLSQSAPSAARELWYAFDALAFLMLLTDQLPQKNIHAVRFEVQAQGSPTVTSALLRLIASAPEAFVLMMLGFISGFTWLIAALCVLIYRDYPDWIFAYHRAVLRFAARLFAYHASLVDRYPPLALEMHTEAVTGR
jgi:hypothetical protein